MISLGTPLGDSATKLLLLGSGELGKELAFEAQRLGIEIIAVDRYDNAPAMQIAHKKYVISMLDSAALKSIIIKERPHFIIPEIEAIATDCLVECEAAGFNVIPNANAVHLTMNRVGIRRLAAEQLKLPTSAYRFATDFPSYEAAIRSIGLPCVVKPVMSSSGKGQMMVRTPEDILPAWKYAHSAGRRQGNEVIVEAFIPFDYEITLLTVRHRAGTNFCAPIGHIQVQGDYQESWQPHPMPAHMLAQAQTMAKEITDALGGYGVFGVEFFVQGDQIYFSEVSPRPHDTGLVTLTSQNLSQFALHLRAALGLSIPLIEQLGPSASYALVAEGKGKNIRYEGVDLALANDVDLRLFGKPEINGRRRLGVILARGETLEEARSKTQRAAGQIKIKVS